MANRPDIDEFSGCCNGVRLAIESAEHYLAGHPSLYSLGSIVHNAVEIDRLSKLGLKIIGYEAFEGLGKGDAVLIRAHGEPPETYLSASGRGVELIDCTCPVVKALQRKISATRDRIRGCGGQIVIFGKHGHAEVLGLVGQTSGEAVVVDSIAGFDEAVSAGAMSLSRPIALFSQTTKDPVQYKALADHIGSRLPAGAPPMEVFNTICHQVALRHSRLQEFARSHDVVIFVCGAASSNGKVLFENCLSVNPRSFRVESADDLDMGVFRPGDTVGICGATSTPRWQLEKIADLIKKNDTFAD